MILSKLPRRWWKTGSGTTMSFLNSRNIIRQVCTLITSRVLLNKEIWQARYCLKEHYSKSECQKQCSKRWTHKSSCIYQPWTNICTRDQYSMARVLRRWSVNWVNTHPWNFLPAWPLTNIFHTLIRKFNQVYYLYTNDMLDMVRFITRICILHCSVQIFGRNVLREIRWTARQESYTDASYWLTGVLKTLW